MHIITMFKIAYQTYEIIANLQHTPNMLSQFFTYQTYEIIANLQHMILKHFKTQPIKLTKL